MNINTLTIFHRADFDGFACEAIARRFLGDTSHYLGFDYGDPLPDLTHYSTVYLLDISLPVDIMRDNAHKLVVIDHHATLIAAVEPFKDSFKGYRCIDGVAACRLAWQYFANGLRGWSKQDYTSIPAKVTEPYAIELLGRYDIWDKR